MVSTKASKLTIIITVLLATFMFLSNSTVHAEGVKKGEAGNELSVEFYQEKVTEKEKKPSIDKTVNQKKRYLPQTGEVKKILYVLLGIGFILLVVLLANRKRKKVGI